MLNIRSFYKSKSGDKRSMSIKDRLRIPIIQAPMFLLSGPEMVIASCKAGVIGSFPTPNARTLEQLEDWLIKITDAVEDDVGAAPWAINIIMHRSNPRRHQDLELAIKYKAPVVITALGSPKEAVDSIHSYGGKIYADVISIDYARKAAASGVDGLALVCAGAGGHTGQLSPFAFIDEVKTFFSGEIILAGGMSSGRSVHAAEVLGADYAYMGTRFIATKESLAQDKYKQMIIESSVRDIVPSDAITGVKANWLRSSLLSAGYDPENMPPAANIDFASAAGDVKRWRDIWAAGQGVGAIKKVQTISEVVDQLEREYIDSKSNRDGRL
jgi:nitronate monooxygenase